MNDQNTEITNNLDKIWSENLLVDDMIGPQLKYPDLASFLRHVNEKSNSFTED